MVNSKVLADEKSEKREKLIAEQAAKSAVCKSQYSSRGESLKERYLQTNSAFRSAKKSYLSVARKSKRQTKEYLALRDSGELPKAKVLASKIDNTWESAYSLQQEVIQLIRVGEGQRLDFCNLLDEARANKCAKISANQCYTNVKLSEWRDLYSKGYIKTKSFDKTWRRPQDYVFETKLAANDSKLDSYLGYVAALEGRAFIERGIKTLPARVGSRLHKHDKLNVEEGSQAEIELMGSGRIKITQLTSYQIRETATTLEQRSLFQKALQKFKTVLPPEDGSHLDPDSFNKKTGGGGVRG